MRLFLGKFAKVSKLFTLMRIRYILSELFLCRKLSYWPISSFQTKPAIINIIVHDIVTLAVLCNIILLPNVNSRHCVHILHQLKRTINFQFNWLLTVYFFWLNVTERSSYNLFYNQWFMIPEGFFKARKFAPDACVLSYIPKSTGTYICLKQHS